MKYNFIIYFIYEYIISVTLSISIESYLFSLSIIAEQALFAIAEQAFIYTSEKEHNDWTA